MHGSESSPRVGQQILNLVLRLPMNNFLTNKIVVVFVKKKLFVFNLENDSKPIVRFSIISLLLLNLPQHIK